MTPDQVNAMAAAMRQQQQQQTPALPSLNDLRQVVREEAKAVLADQEKGLFSNPYVKYGTIAVGVIAIGGTLYYFNERLNALESK
jgi:hypothetical protein